MSKSIDLYGAAPSAPCRAVLLTGQALNLNLNLIPINLFAGDHLKPEYLKINPQHTVPTLVDDGFAVWESRAIMRYLANKYGKNTDLYPEDPKTRAQIDQKLDFDLGTLYGAYAVYYYPQAFEKKPAIPEALEKVKSALGFLNSFLEGQKYLVGSNLTLADLAISVTVSNIALIDNILDGYPNIQKWLSLVSVIAPGYDEINTKGIALFKDMVNSMK